MTCQTPEDDFVRWDAESVTCLGQNHEGACAPKASLATPTKSIRIECWNVRTMFSVGKTAQIVAEAKKYRVKVLGISKCRWSGFGRLRTATGETILYSGRDDNVHQSGVALLLNKETAESLLDWNPVSDRIITARFNSKYTKTTCVQVYAPTNDAEPEVKDEFYEQLQAVIERAPSHDMLVMMGDWNAKVGRPNQGEEGIVGKHALEGDRTDNRERFVNFCALNNLAITSTMFPHKDIHKYTWTSPDGLHKNQIDHIAVNAKFKRSVRDTRAYRGADVGSDHNLVTTETKLKLSRVKKTNTTSRKYEISKLNSTDVQKEFVLELRNRFSCLKIEETEDNEEEETDRRTEVDSNIEQCWKTVKETFNETAKNVLGFKKRKSKNWISAKSWEKIEERRKLKMKVNETKSDRLRSRLQAEYQSKDKEVKRSVRKDKREWAEHIAREAENAASQGNMKGVYEATKKLCNEKPRHIDMVKDKDGNLLTKDDEIRKRWSEHFDEVLNRPVPSSVADIHEETECIDNIEVGYITRDEIRNAMHKMKKGKAAGIDSITIELLRAGGDVAIEVLYELFTKIWDKEEIPEDWSKGLIVKLPKRGNLTDCDNWRGITLILVIMKIFGSAVINRIRVGVNNKLRNDPSNRGIDKAVTPQSRILCCVASSSK